MLLGTRYLATLMLSFKVDKESVLNIMLMESFATSETNVTNNETRMLTCIVGVEWISHECM